MAKKTKSKKGLKLITGGFEKSSEQAISIDITIEPGMLFKIGEPLEFSPVLSVPEFVEALRERTELVMKDVQRLEKKLPKGREKMKATALENFAFNVGMLEAIAELGQFLENEISCGDDHHDGEADD